MKSVFLLIFFISCSNGRVVSTSEYYADGLIDECEKAISWKKCDNLYSESFAIYKKLKLNKKMTLVLARRINLALRFKKRKYLEPIEAELKSIKSNLYLSDAKLLLELSFLFFDNEKSTLNNRVEEILGLEEVSIRRLYLISKFSKKLNKKNYDVLMTMVSKYNDKIADLSEMHQYYLKKIESNQSIK